MAQHDYNISNATGANFRGDLNNALQAVVSQNSGSTQPAPMFPGMLWLDLSVGGDGIMRRRNQANTAWLTDLGIDQTARDAAAAAQVTASAAMPKAGGTFTGAVNLIAGEPSANQAVSRAAADALYQVRLPVATAGALLVGAAGGWNTSVPAGSAGAVLSISGGLPVWQNTATTAAPGIIVRTLNDGTIDPSFIPAVASGLRFRGTFKPVVNAEYPTTGGSGAAGVPAVGDFWVIDGLTTGGYTYLTGSLAGVTVYNGDSIAFNGSGAWFRMGSTVNLQGYLKTDGSIAMVGALNMGGQAINNVNGIAGVAGNPVPLTNFLVDATNTVISPQRGSTGADLVTMPAGQIGTDMGRAQIYVGSGSLNVGLLPVRFFSSTAAYGFGDYVVQIGQQYRARGAISAGAFVASQWATILDSDGGSLYGQLRVRSGGSIEFYKAGDVDRSTLFYADAATGETRINRFLAGGGSETAIAISPTATYVTRLFADIATTLNGNATVNGTLTLNVANVGNVINMSPLGTTVGSVNYGLRLLTTTSNQDRLDFTVSRGVAGSTWDSANWKIQRHVDATALGYLLFGTSSNAQAITLGTGSESALSIDTDGYTKVRRRLRVYDFQNQATLGQIVMGDGDANLYWTASQFLFSHGVVAPAFTPTCDLRLKENVERIKPRNFDGLAFYEFDRIATGRHERGPIAQDVEKIAPDHVSEVSDPNGDEWKAVNVASLALEIALNLTARVAALESTTEH